MDVADAVQLDDLIKELHNHPVNSNQFFQAFKNRSLSPRQLRLFIKQYHYFCFQFVKILEGLLYRTPIDELEMRIELAKTLYSELGSGSIEHAHIRHLQRFARSAGLQHTDLEQVIPLPDVMKYLQTLRQLFLEADYLTALGAELAVEMTAASEFQYFYPALQTYEQFQPQDLVFFELHIREEPQHGDWLIQAVRNTVKSQGDFDCVVTGARTTANAWLLFWDGMYQAVFETTPMSVCC